MTNPISGSFDPRGFHALEAPLVGFVNLGNPIFILPELGHQLGRVQCTVAAASLDDFGLLFQGKVPPAKFWSHNFLEELENLVMRDRTRVGKVIDASLTMLCKNDGSRQKIMQHGVAVGNVNHSLVAKELCHKVSRMKVIANRHAKTKNEAVGVAAEDL